VLLEEGIGHAAAARVRRGGVAAACRQDEGSQAGKSEWRYGLKERAFHTVSIGQKTAIARRENTSRRPAQTNTESWRSTPI
jgi:hypothetical protein